MNIQETLKTLGIEAVNRGASTGGYWFNTRGTQIDSVSPVDGKVIASVSSATEAEYEAVEVHQIHLARADTIFSEQTSLSRIRCVIVDVGGNECDVVSGGNQFISRIKYCAMEFEERHLTKALKF